MASAPAEKRPVGRPAGSARLTDKQTQFVYNWVRKGCTQTEAARLAGYGSPAQVATDLVRTPHVMAAVRQERAQLIEGDLANLAAQTIKELMGPDNPGSVRLGAAKLAWQAAGVLSENATHKPDKSLQDMTADELADAIRKMDEAIASKADAAQPARVITVDPDPK